LPAKRLAPDRRKAGRHHQVVALLGEKARVGAHLEVVEPLGVLHHGGALLLAVSGAFVAPQMDEEGQLAALGLQIGERRAGMAYLRRKAVLGREVEMSPGLALPGAISANIDEHAVLRFEIGTRILSAGQGPASIDI